jgi:cell wall-associated NlpC family hydrolase/prophage tail gpP-like protein
MRKCHAVITVNTGTQGSRQFRVQRVLNYTTDQSIDNDTDQFSIDIGNINQDLPAKLDLEPCLKRDNEVQVQLYLNDFKNDLVPVFNGIADTVQLETDHILSIAGRDTASSLAVDSDALFGKWASIKPHKFIAERARKLGITRTRIAHMSEMKRVVTDGSEKEWAFWYRIARNKSMYMWTDSVGTLIVDKLDYGTAPIYNFGHPLRGKGGFIKVIDVSYTSTKQGRLGKLLLYGETSPTAKKAVGIAASAVDPHIRSWRKKPLAIQLSSTHRSIKELKKDADEQIFESIVGAREVTLTIRDEGKLIKQNSICLVNLPEFNLTGLWFIVGVQRQGGPGGFTQLVRLRERNFAISKRVPEAPKLVRDPARLKPASAIADYLATHAPDIRWPDSFVLATNETGVKAGWDFALFLGVLLAICTQETHFKNIREYGGAYSGEEWLTYTKWINKHGGGAPGFENKTRGEGEAEYRKAFANAKGSRGNPYASRSAADGEAGVGPMQLTTRSFKEDADKLGWFGIPKRDELEGGRWNPDSNIRIGAKVLLGKLNASPPANPQDPASIWLGVMRYNGSPAYRDKVKKIYEENYKKVIQDAEKAVKSVRDGSTDTNIPVPGHGVLQFPSATPDEALRAISWALSHIDDPYRYGGSGPLYDCASFVTKALSMGGLYLKDLLDEPHPGHHGDNTYSLWRKGRFQAVAKSDLLPCDMVFFRGIPPEHMGMYLTDGLFIHDPHTGDRVKVSSLGNDWYHDAYVGARRVIAWRTRPD